jgi:hypothetical protein
MIRIKYAIGISICILIIAVYFLNNVKMEAFGMSPGTLVQLSSSHVPTEEDIYQASEENERVKRDIANMTKGSSYSIV